MLIGQAYSDVLTLRERKALQASCDMLIDSSFHEFENIKGPKDIVDTTIGIYLPERYLYKYTPLFFKKFAVCIITVAWKLTQPEHIPLSSLAEELAAWVIIEHAKVVLEAEGLAAQLLTEQEQAVPETNEENEEAEDNFETFIDTYFEDLDFEFLYDDAYDGIDETPLAQSMDILSLAFDTWFKSFSDEPSRTPHPYVAEAN